MKLESMSKNIVNILWALAQNEGLARLLLYDDSSPFDYSLPTPELGLALISPNSTTQKIAPTPFDADSLTDEDNSFIRIYFNQGELDAKETIIETELIIDIICARNLWLINEDGESKIRPYEMMSRIIDILGKNGFETTIKLQFPLEFQGFQHLYVNSKYDCIRLYAKYTEIET